MREQPHSRHVWVIRQPGGDSGAAGLHRSGPALRANGYIFFHVLLTIAVGLLASLLSGGMWLFVLAATLVAVIAPIVFLQTRARRRRDALEEELPDILNLIAGSLRSGWGIRQAIDLVVDEVGDPARSEFRRVQAESRLGLPLEDALRRMANRADSEDLRWTVSAISIQREVGATCPRSSTASPEPSASGPS